MESWRNGEMVKWCNGVMVKWRAARPAPPVHPGAQDEVARLVPLERKVKIFIILAILYFVNSLYLVKQYQLPNIPP